MILAASDSTTGWAIGYTVAIVVVLVVVALVVPILLLAHTIGNEAADIDDVAAAVGAQHRGADGPEHHDRPRRA